MTHIAAGGKCRRERAVGRQADHFGAELAEGTETIRFFVGVALAARAFPISAYAFAGLTFMSAVARVGLAWHAFRDYGDNA
jgi:hypothetical protein